MNSIMNESTVMVVDDTPANLRLLNDMLNSVGCRVLSFPRGELALKALSNQIPDIILLDINMPGMNGYEVCKKIKEDEETKEIPVLFISAYMNIDEKLKAFKSGGVDYITKPFYESEVMARVETHLELQKQKREICNNYQQLQELEGLRKNLTQMIVHDLRSPLTVINGSLDLVANNFMESLPGQCDRLVRHALNSTRKTIEMVSSLLDLSRLETGQMPIEKHIQNIKDLIEEALDFLRDNSKNINFDLKQISYDQETLLDKELIRRVLVNLLSNALKFSPSDSQIEISSQENGQNYIISISDQGPGIPEDFKDMVFEKYAQVKTGDKQQEYSSGIGLAFCKLAVEAHGGQISVQNNQSTEGCTFTFTIPKI